MARSDEEILYDLYVKLGESVMETSKKGKAKADSAQLTSILNNIPLLFLYLDEMPVSQKEIKKYLRKAKPLYLNYSSIKKRHPELVSSFLANKMDQLLHSIARHEAELVNHFRTQELGGARFDIASLLEENNSFKKLSNYLAVDVIKTILNDNSRFTSVSKSNVLFITDTGKKYHKQDCPYCKGKALKPTTRTIISNLLLEPCKCIKDEEEQIRLNDSYRTIFIDESIHPVAWNENGTSGKAGSYSYIICKGRLENESEITPENTIDSGVEYVTEMQHTEKVTKTAIGVVMMIAAFDYNFNGNIKIFTDNESTMQTWQKDKKNMRIAELFESVTVHFVPREQNKTADSIGRSLMCLKMPIDKYNDIKTKYGMYNTLLKENKRLQSNIDEDESVIKILRNEQDETKEKMARLNQENIRLRANQSFLRQIINKAREWFYSRQCSQAAFSK